MVDRSVRCLQSRFLSAWIASLGSAALLATLLQKRALLVFNRGVSNGVWCGWVSLGLDGDLLVLGNIAGVSRVLLHPLIKGGSVCCYACSDGGEFAQRLVLQVAGGDLFGRDSFEPAEAHVAWSVSRWHRVEALKGVCWGGDLSHRLRRERWRLWRETFKAILINGPTYVCVFGEALTELDVGIAGESCWGELPLVGATFQSLGTIAGQPAILHINFLLFG